jgi:RNA polymerase sigma factor (sigma-70 family)
MKRSEQERIFEEWLAAHGAIVVRTARAFAPVGDRDDLEQELLIAIWRAVPAFRGNARVSTFIYRVVHNAALTWRRGARGRGERAALVAAEAGQMVPTRPVDRKAEERRLTLLYAEIQALPPLDRSIVLLSLDGVSYAEIAEIHGLTPNHIGVRLTRARAALTAKLQGAEK